MLTIGEFSNICRVSTKTLRYYAEIGLILPDEINPENGYRYYSIEQLEKMLLINRLKDYCFSLEEIKLILESEERMDEVLFTALNKKKKEICHGKKKGSCEPSRLCRLWMLHEDLSKKRYFYSKRHLRRSQQSPVHRMRKMRQRVPCKHY